MKKFLFALIALSLLVTSAVFVFGQTAPATGDKKVDGAKKVRKGGHHRRGGRGKGFGFRGLELTEAQKAQVKEITTASRAKLAPVREALRANRQKMQAATANGTFDEAAVTAAAGEAASLRAQMTVERLKVRSQIFGILTDEQKAKLSEAKAKRGERRKARRGAKAEKVSE